jgi:hypothetical protein
MRRNYATLYARIVVLLCTFSSSAQQQGSVKTPETGNDKPAAAGVVTGRVYLEDTKTPARRAGVSLHPAATLSKDAPAEHNGAVSSGGVSMSVQSGFDGSFAFAHVPPGTYYVIASCPGYVSPYTALSLAEARSPYEAWHALGASQATAREAVIAAIPRITVQSGLGASVDVSLERGGGVSGTVTYDDGTPAAGLQVTVLAKILQNGKETWAPLKPGTNLSTAPLYTDDRGNYRMSGLPAWKYLVQVTLDLQPSITYASASSTSTSTRGGRFDTMAIYSGSTPRLNDAMPFAVELHEEHAGEDIRIPLSKLHTVTGTIVSAHDGHVINSGEVQLLHADDRSIAGTASVDEDEAGFTLNFIYDGQYILSSPVSTDVDYQLTPDPAGTASPPRYEGHPRHLYGPAMKPLQVNGDMERITIAVPEPSAQEARALKDAFDQQAQQNQNQQPR